MSINRTSTLDQLCHCTFSFLVLYSLLRYVCCVHVIYKYQYEMKRIFFRQQQHTHTQDYEQTVGNFVDRKSCFEIFSTASISKMVHFCYSSFESSNHNKHRGLNKPNFVVGVAFLPVGFFFVACIQQN